MKIPTRFLLIAVFSCVAISTAQAKSWWQAMDIETAHTPARYGYHVSRTDADDKDHYVITVDPAAAAVLTGASIGWIGKDKEPLKMEITKLNGQTKIEFTVPPEFLQPSSYLQLDSGPIKYCGPENTFDFMGYRLRLDNIQRDSGGDFDFIPECKIVNGGFEFSYILNESISISGGPAELKRRVLSITLEGATQSRVSVPMRLENMGEQGPTKFFLSNDQVGDFILAIEMTSQADILGAKVRKHYMGLGILAANAELVAEQEVKPQIEGAKQKELLGVPFHEPTYPEGVDTSLLCEMAWFFGGSGDFKKEKTAENWEDLLMRMKKAGLPRLAEKKDLKVTKEEITNLADEAVLMVFGHQHPVNRALNIAQFRTHWLPAKGTMKNESGYAGKDLFWRYPYDVVLGKSFNPPAFLKPTNLEKAGGDE